MFSRAFTLAAVAIKASQLVSAQLQTDCDPTTAVDGCGLDPAFGTNVDIDFAANGESEYFKALDGATIQYTDEGASFSIDSYTSAPAIGSDQYIFGGRVDVTMQAAPGQGIATTVVLLSDDLDSIDWEWVGSNDTHVQSNYFGKGDDSTLDLGINHDASDSTTTTRIYSLDWEVDSYVRWIIDGVTVRQLNYAEAKNGTRFPQTPMRIRLGAYVAGRPGASQATIEWAGGVADMSQAPFVAYCKGIKIQDYSQGATNYKWAPAPNDGSYEDITVLGVDGQTEDTAEPPTTATTDGNSNDGTGSGLPSGAIAGIAVGVVVAVALILALAGYFVLRRRRRRGNMTDQTVDTTAMRPGIDDNNVPLHKGELLGSTGVAYGKRRYDDKPELDGSAVAELDATTRLAGISPRTPQELIDESN